MEGNAKWRGMGTLVLLLWLAAGCEAGNDPPKPEQEVVARWWSFGKFVFGAATEQQIGTERAQIGGSVNEKIDFGGLIFSPPGSGPIAQGEVFSNDAGTTYWVSAQGPNATLIPGATIGSSARLQQFQVFRKLDSNAVLQLVVSQTFLEGIDANGGEPTPLECPWRRAGQNAFVCRRVMSAWVNYDVTAFSYFDQKTILRTGGTAELLGFRGDFHLDAYTTAGGRRFWNNDNFSFNDDEDGDGGGHAVAGLIAPLTINVPLDSIKVGNDFYLSVVLKAATHNHRQRESYLSAYFRDPVGSNGITYAFSGLEPIETPAEKPEEPAPLSAPACSGGAGVLQFSAPSFETPELLGLGGTVLVTRTGGTAGAVSATIATGGGSAVPGSDYDAVSTIVLFGDGEGGSRGINIPIRNDNTAEADKTVSVTLSDPKGCATLGQPSSATVTILDDDQPIVLPPSFTVGGTLSGLAGTGLVLSNLGATVSPGNGPFEFATSYSDGIPYDVRVTTQPTNPDQVCSVNNGSGTITGADVTDVLVNCVTQQTNGALDPNYGVAGKVTTGLAGGAVAMALQADGKAVMLGERQMARYKTDGSLDTGFGTGGVVNIGFNGGLSDEAHGLALQPDGKIVVVGSTRVGSQDDFAVARYLSNGTLDPAFGTAGLVTTDFSGKVDRAHAPLIVPNGEIVVAGHAAKFDGIIFDNDFAVARYSSTGALVTGFGTGGKVTTNIGGRTDLAYAAALQSDGKILVTGRVADGGGDNPDVGIVRYNADGTPDPGFGAQGILRRDLSNGNWDEASAIVLQSDGRFVVAVQAVVGSTFDFELARFESNGLLLDQSFGNQGVATTAFGTQTDFPKALALQTDGKIVVAGSSTLTTSDFAIARFLANGALDTSFGTGGKVTVDFFGASDGAQAVAVQADGKILAGGFAANGTQAGVGIVRILP